MKNTEKYEALKAMNTLAKYLNNETFYYDIWIWTIPDEADDDELMEIANEEYQEETFEEAAKKFIEYWRRYAKDGGLYLDGKVYGN